jgi:hypothetical protein
MCQQAKGHEATKLLISWLELPFHTFTVGTTILGLILGAGPLRSVRRLGYQGEDFQSLYCKF